MAPHATGTPLNHSLEELSEIYDHHYVKGYFTTNDVPAPLPVRFSEYENDLKRRYEWLCFLEGKRTAWFSSQGERTKAVIRDEDGLSELYAGKDEMARGDIPKSIQCYMHESGASEDDARMYIKTLIRDTWKKLNKEREGADSKFAREFNECATNLARMAQFMYGEGDGHGRPHVTKSHVLSLLINPIQMVK
ncbi:R-linalool synthase QH1, chloroplastic-like protein [Tanacetum coccineum]